MYKSKQQLINHLPITNKRTRQELPPPHPSSALSLSLSVLRTPSMSSNKSTPP